MLTLKMLRDDPDFVVRKLAVKNFDAKAIVDKVLELDTQRRALQTESDGLLSQQKQKAGLIGGLMKEGKRQRQKKPRKRLPNSRHVLQSFLQRLTLQRKNLSHSLFSSLIFHAIW